MVGQNNRLWPKSRNIDNIDSSIECFANPIINITRSKMKPCNLCEEIHSKLYKPEEKFLDTQLSSVIKFLFGGFQVQIPSSFLICNTCAAALIQTELVLTRLSKALHSSRNLKNEILHNASINNEEDANKELNTNDVFTMITSSCNWTFYCIHCEFNTNKVKVYKRHLLSKHQDTNQKIYQCMFCKETYQRISGIKNHISWVHGNKPRPKRKSKKSITFDKTALLSSSTVEGQQENDTSVFNTNSDSNAADKTNMSYTFECTLCLYKTVYRKMFKKHLHFKHKVEDSRVYKCKQCPTTFMRLFSLQNHIAIVHENKPRSKLQRRKTLRPDFELDISGNEESQMPVQNVEQKQQKLEDRDLQVKEETENQGGEVEKHETDNINLNGKVSEEPQHEKETEDHGNELINYEIYNKNQKANNKSDEQESEEDIQTPKTKKRNLSASETVPSKWIFQCCDCEFETEKKKKFRTHLSYQHGLFDRDLYKCLYCSASFERYILLHSHMVNKHTVDLDPMIESPAIYSDSSQDNRNTHTAKKRKVEEMTVRSEESNHEESSKEEQTNNMNVSGNNTHQKELCVVCGINFSTVEKLRAHVGKHHTGDEIKFTSLEKYEAHMFSGKYLEKKLNCQFPSCPKRFSKRSKMQQHMREKHTCLKI